MAWLAVDPDGKEYVFETKPYPRNSDRWWYCDDNPGSNYCELPKGSIEKLTGKILSNNDEPVEITE